MTTTLPLSPLATTPTTPRIAYQVGMPHPETHLFEVTLTICNWQQPWLDLKMPVWTPGSYLVREYSKQLQDFQAISQNMPLPWQKLAKNHWRLETQQPTTQAQPIQIRYRIYAHELSVRTNHLDSSHGYFNPAALCFFIPGYLDQPITLEILPPHPSWQVTTPLPPVAGQANTFMASDFDTLVDSPFEIGTQTVYEFAVLDKAHQLAVWGEGNLQPQQAIADISKIIEVEAQLFGGLPYDKYLFLLHLSGQGYGGLEHKFGCSLIYSRFSFTNPEKYQRFLQLVAHEFFHLWNVKRIRPEGLEIFDYEAENYTPSLWFSEGTTSYYDPLLPLRAGIYNARTYLKFLSESITRLQTTPGRTIQPLSESSFDAWIKLYRPDANSRNSQISYYLKGEMVSLLLDLLIRRQHRNQRSLDDVLRQLWQQFGQPEKGFSPQQLQTIIESVAALPESNATPFWQSFWQNFLHGTKDLPFTDYLQPFGLELSSETKPEQPPYLGLIVKTEVKTEGGAAVVKTVDPHSPAQAAGIDVGDELLAINGFRISAEQLPDRLRDFTPGQTLSLTFFHQDQLCTHELTLQAPQPSAYILRPIADATAEQQNLLVGWLGETARELFGT
jgi:predicted metalloprotease with PDZ domain